MIFNPTELPLIVLISDHSDQIATTRVDDASPRITYSNPKISTDFGQKGYGYYGGTGQSVVLRDQSSIASIADVQ